MVRVLKSNGQPRCTIHFQTHNVHCLHESHHTPAPFDMVSSIPIHTYNATADAHWAYHQIKLDEKSRPLTTFITHGSLLSLWCLFKKIWWHHSTKLLGIHMISFHPVLLQESPLSPKSYSSSPGGMSLLLGTTWVARSTSIQRNAWVLSMTLVCRRSPPSRA